MHRKWLYESVSGVRNRSFVQPTGSVRIDTFEVGAAFFRVGSKPEPDASLNMIGVDRLPSARTKAIAEAEFHELEDLG